MVTTGVYCFGTVLQVLTHQGLQQVATLTEVGKNGSLSQTAIVQYNDLLPLQHARRELEDLVMYGMNPSERGAHARIQEHLGHATEAVFSLPADLDYNNRKIVEQVYGLCFSPKARSWLTGKRPWQAPWAADPVDTYTIRFVDSSLAGLVLEGQALRATSLSSNKAVIGRRVQGPPVRVDGMDGDLEDLPRYTPDNPAITVYKDL